MKEYTKQELAVIASAGITIAQFEALKQDKAERNFLAMVTKSAGEILKNLAEEKEKTFRSKLMDFAETELRKLPKKAVSLTQSEYDRAVSLLINIKRMGEVTATQRVRLKEIGINVPEEPKPASAVDTTGIEGMQQQTQSRRRTTVPAPAANA